MSDTTQQPPQPPGDVPPPATGSVAPGSLGPDPEARTWGMLCHLASLAMYIGIPFGNIIGPLVVWLLKKDQYPFVDDQGRESINFQITLTIAGLIAGVSLFICIGVVLLPLVLIAGLVLTIMAAVKANQGVLFRYPWCLRLIK